MYPQLSVQAALVAWEPEIYIQIITRKLLCQIDTTITFGYWDGYYTSTANDAGKHVIDKLQKSFRDNDIDECDQVAILSQVKPVDNHIASLEPNEFEVKVKVKKDLPKIVHCAQNICSAPPLGITVKSIW